MVVIPHGGRRFAHDWLAIVAHWNCIRVVVIAIHPLIDGKRRVAIGVGSIVTTVYVYAFALIEACRHTSE